MASPTCTRCKRPILKDGQMCLASLYSVKDGLIGTPRWPCRAEDDGQSIAVDGLIVRIGDRSGAPIMHVEDPYAPDPPKKPKTKTCGGFTEEGRE